MNTDYAAGAKDIGELFGFPEGIPVYTVGPGRRKRLLDRQEGIDLDKQNRFVIGRAIEWMHSPECRGSKFIEAHRPLRGIFPFLAVADELGLLERVPGGNGWLRPSN